MAAAPAPTPTPAPAITGTEVYRNTFAGPYSAGANPILKGCTNNWQYGRKTMRLAADTASGRPGTVQRISIDDVQSGAMQFFVGPLPWLARGSFYRVSFWMRTEGLASLDVQVRKIAYPWTTFIPGPTIDPPKREWTRYEFIGECSTDVDNDHGVLFNTSEVGTIWLDEVVIEKLAGDPRAMTAEPPFPALPGNQLARSSCEAPRDPLWTGGVYGDPEAEWEDPQPRRAEGGFAGANCLAFPASTRGGISFIRSTPIPVAPRSRYCASLWMKASVPGTAVRVALQSLKDPQYTSPGGGFKLTADWQRYEVATAPLPDGARHAILTFSIPAGQAGEVFIDAVQVELGEHASAYTPAHPLELAAGLVGGARLLTWGESASLHLEAWPAGAPVAAPLAAEVVVTAFPDREVLRRQVTLTPGAPLDLPLAGELRGLYRITLGAVEAARAAPVEALFAVLPPPRGLDAAGGFGVHLSVRPEVLEYARRIGYTWVRCHDGSGITKWANGEPEPGKFRWFDRQVDALRAAGFAILGLPDAPRWPKHQQRDGKPVMDAAAYGRWCEAVAAHYRGRIDHWEIWNEPYITYFWPFSVADYGHLATAGMAGIRRGNPQAKVLGACNELSSGGWKDPLPTELKRGFDLGTFHYYQGNLAGNGEGLRAQVATYARTFGAGGATEHWNSEGGFGKMGGNSFYSMFGDQAQLNARATVFAARVLIEHRQAGVRFFHYTMHQNDTIIYHGGYKMMVGFDRSPTPAAIGNAIAAWCIDGLDSRPLPAASPDGIVQVLFAGRDRLAWTIYRLHDERGADCVVDLSALPAAAQVLDLAGADPRQRGEKAWPVGVAPLFVVAEGVDAGTFASACQAAIGRR